MKRFLLAFACAALAFPFHAQESSPTQWTDRSALIEKLGFEAQPKGDMPGGWGGGPPGTLFADDKIVHGGRLSARIQRQADSPDDFSTLTNDIPMDFAGATIAHRVRWRGGPEAHRKL